MKTNITHVQYCDNESVFVISTTGQIKRIFVPFEVICIKSVGNIPLNSLVIVERVFSNNRAQLIYLILGKHFYHSSFLIY